MERPVAPLPYGDAVALPLPRSLSPSKVSAFKSCALAFRFSAIDRLPETPSLPAVRGTLVHRALQHLFWRVPPMQRSRAAASAMLASAAAELADEIDALGLDHQASLNLSAEAERLLDGYFALEDPTTPTTLGVELMLEARLGGVLLRGIIDRLDLDDAGHLVVVDYKTGRPPRQGHERDSLAGVHYYALLLEEVLGTRPSRVQLLYLGAPLAVSTEPTGQAIEARRRATSAVWAAVERGCAAEDFRPRPSSLCPHCSWQSYCPAFGGHLPDVQPLLAADAARRVPA